MTQTLRKVFDLGIAAAVAIFILNFAATSFGFGLAEAQVDADSVELTSFTQTATYKVASLDG